MKDMVAIQQRCVDQNCQRSSNHAPPKTHLRSGKIVQARALSLSLYIYICVAEEFVPQLHLTLLPWYDLGLSYYQ